MNKKIVLILVISGALIGVGAIAGIILWSHGKAEPAGNAVRISLEYEQISKNDYVVSPPDFSSRDNKECRDKVTEMYEMSMSVFESYQESLKRLSQSYQDILRMQTDYGIELVNNQDFLDWTVSDYEGPNPTISKAMKRKFGFKDEVEAEPLRTQVQVDRAAQVLFKFRERLGLEATIMFRRQLKLLSVQSSEYEMCTESTREQAATYNSDRLSMQTDKRRYHYYPMLDRLTDWMRDTYG